jgi:tetratricopeptide (TPR) repeat protein
VRILPQHQNSTRSQRLGLRPPAPREFSGLAHARLRSWSKAAQFSGLFSVYVALREKGKFNLELLDELSELVRAIADQYLRLEALREVAKLLIEAEHQGADEVFDEALEAAQAFQDEKQMGAPLQELAKTLVELQRYDEAFRAVCTIVEKQQRAWALRRLAGALVDARRYDRALEVAGSIGDPLQGEQVQQDVALALARAGSFAKAWQFVRGSCTPATQAAMLYKLAAMHTAAGQYDDALEMIRSLSEVGHMRGEADVETLCNLAVTFVEAGDPSTTRCGSNITDSRRLARDRFHSWRAPHGCWTARRKSGRGCRTKSLCRCRSSLTS